jgi:hypothetical protein
LVILSYFSLLNLTAKSHAISKFHLYGRKRDGGEELTLLKISALGRDLNFFSLVTPDFPLLVFDPRKWPTW